MPDFPLQDAPPASLVRVRSLADHLDALPLLIGRPPADEVVCTSVPTGAHAIAPISAFDPIDAFDHVLPGDARLIVVAATDDVSVGMDAVDEVVAVSPIPITGAWLGEGSYAVLASDGTWTRPSPRTVSSFVEEMLLRPQPSKR